MVSFVGYVGLPTKTPSERSDAVVAVAILAECPLSHQIRMTRNRSPATPPVPHTPLLFCFLKNPAHARTTPVFFGGRPFIIKSNEPNETVTVTVTAVIPVIAVFHFFCGDGTVSQIRLRMPVHLRRVVHRGACLGRDARTTAARDAAAPTATAAAVTVSCTHPRDVWHTRGGLTRGGLTRGGLSPARHSRVSGWSRCRRPRTMRRTEVTAST